MPRFAASASAPAENEPVGHAQAAALGIHPIVLPTPFPVGAINCWLLEGTPLTLVDAGIASAEALVELERQLAVRGHRIEDLQTLALTHEHADHVGLSSIIVERSGAEVVAIDALAGRLADPSGYGARETTFMVSALQRHGLQHELAVALSGMQRVHRAWAGGPVEVTQPLASGSRIVLGGLEFQLLLRPGHSVTDTLFIAHEHGVVLGGDHLLLRVSSNPLMACDPSRLDPQRPDKPTAEDRAPALRHYIDGLRLTVAMNPAVVLGGHGPAVTDVPTLVAERLHLHDRRKRKILGLLDESLPPTAFDVARKMWGDTAWKQPLLCLSEVLGHLDLLVEDKAVVPLRDEDVARWKIS